MQVQGDSKPYDDINITPMLDLAYVLLVIFILMCTASVQGIKANLPKGSKAPSHDKKPPKTKIILIDNKGGIFLDGQPKTLQQLQQSLSQIKSDTPVVVKGDSLTHYQSVADVLDVLGQLNISQVGLATKGKQK